MKKLLVNYHKQALVPLYAFIPAICLTVLFIARMGGERFSFTHPSRALVKNLVFFSDLLFSYETLEIWLAKILSVLFLVLFLYVITEKVVYRQLNSQDGLLIVAITYVLFYFIVPDKMSQGGLIKIRLSLYVCFAMILWFGANSYRNIIKWGIQGISITIALSLVSLHIVKYAELNSYIEEYVSGMTFMRMNATLLPLNFASFKEIQTKTGKPVSMRVNPFRHASGYIAAQRNIVDFSNYECRKDYFPIAFRDYFDPFTYIGEPEFEPSRADFLTYNQRTGGTVDYVLVWGSFKKHFGSGANSFILKQLEDGYSLVYTSPERELMRLYRRKE